MTLSEFKAWLEGFSASFADGVPSAEQWSAVSKKLSGVQQAALAPYTPRLGDTITKPIDTVRPYWLDAPAGTGAPGWPCGLPVVTC